VASAAFFHGANTVSICVGNKEPLKNLQRRALVLRVENVLALQRHNERDVA